MIRYLLGKNARLATRDAESTSPLDDAVWRDELEATAILVAHGANLNEVESKTGATPINEAAYQGHTRLVRYLLQFHPDVEIRDKEGYRPLELRGAGRKIQLCCCWTQNDRQDTT
jgi:ankyrin repeat protein